MVPPGAVATSGAPNGALPIDAPTGVLPEPLGWPRLIEQRRWFAWRPVRTERHGWRWLVFVSRRTRAHRAGDWVFETRSYLP